MRQDTVLSGEDSPPAINGKKKARRGSAENALKQQLSKTHLCMLLFHKLWALSSLKKPYCSLLLDKTLLVCQNAVCCFI